MKGIYEGDLRCKTVLSNNKSAKSSGVKPELSSLVKAFSRITFKLRGFETGGVTSDIVLSLQGVRERGGEGKVVNDL